MVLGEIFSPDLLIVIAVVALLFGGAKLPKLARSLGSAKGEFERGLRDGDATASTAPASATTTVLEAPTEAERRIAEAEARRLAAEAEIARLDERTPPAG